MRIAVGCDHRGSQAQTWLLQMLSQLGHDVVGDDTSNGKSVDYPDVALEVGQRVSNGGVDRGILICGTGIGMAIVANKFPGVRAAAVYDDVTAEMSRRHNDANVLCLAGDLLGEDSLRRLIGIWLTTEFEGGRHSRRVEKINKIDSQDNGTQTSS